ncbi:MAG: hypothetical protein MJ178_00145 [Treponemataceae bacterium]|nr:hypothetical protein [Treponemataceae bacterium]
MSLELENDSQELEKYGVWVKKAAPANEETPIADTPVEETTAESLVADLPDFDFIDDPAVEPELSEMPDFSEVISDDFTIDVPAVEDPAAEEQAAVEEPAVGEEPVTAEEPVAEESFIDESVFDIPLTEDTISEDISLDDFSIEEPVAEDIALDDFSIEESAADEPALDDFSIEESAADEPEITEEFSLDIPDMEETIAESDVPEMPDMPEMNADDIFAEEFSTEETVVEEPVVEETTVDTATDALDTPSFEEVALDDFDTPVAENPLEPEVSITPETPDMEMFGDVSFEDITLSVPETQDSTTPSADDFTLPTDDTSEISFDIDTTATEEVNIDDFLGLTDDMSSPAVSEELSFEDTGLRDFTTSESVSLDDFMSAPQEEKNDITNDDPLDIDLAFDDSFAGSTQASPEDSIETDMAAESAPDESFDVDDIFDSIQEVSFPGDETTEEPAVIPEGEEISFDEVNEFDDLLGSLNADSDQPSDHENAAAAPAQSFTPSKPEVRDYEMTVNMDDSDEDDEFDEASATVRAAVPAVEETPAEPAPEPELTESDVMSDDMKAVLAQLDEDFTEDTEITISQDSLDALTDVKEEPAMSETTNNALLEKILSELTSLKSEISSIRADVDNLKNQGVSAGPAPEAPADDSAEEDEIDFTPAEETSAGGFFGDEDGDDTISLSGDELDNILNCANFTEEEAPEITVEEPVMEEPSPAAEEEPVFGDDLAVEESAVEEPSFEEPVTDEAADDENQSFYEDADVADSNELTESFNSMEQPLEEPVIDEFAITESLMEDESEELPEEIEIPQMGDDFIVESSTTDFLDGMEEEKSIADSITDQNDSFLSSDENIDMMTEELGNEEEVLEVAANDPIDESEDLTESETETDATSSFPTEEDIGLAEEETFSVFDEDAPAEPSADSEYADEEIDTTPTEEVFGKEQWPAFDDMEETIIEMPSEEPVADEEPAVEEPVSEEEPAVEDEPVADEEPAVEDEPVADEEPAVEDEPVADEEPAAEGETSETDAAIPEDLKEDVKSVLMYMDQLLENLPEEKIAEFARSEHFDVYKKLFTELGLA